jgi:hypothetical protein
MSHYREEKSWSTKKVIWTAIAAFLGLVLLSWGGYALSVALSGPKGVGDAIKTKNSASNWTSAQKEFEKRYEEVKTLDRQIAVHAKALEADPQNPILQTNVTGVTSGCMSAVADYNADSRSYLMEEFKSVDLPYQIDDSLPKTDCK